MPAHRYSFAALIDVYKRQIQALDEVLITAKTYHKPVVVHVNTVKGKGQYRYPYLPA